MQNSGLAAYACNPAQTRGRRYPESPAPTRTDYQRDRDRIVHSTAFRRLVYKTQVFLNHEGDLFRTRLTHSLEVAQLGRSIARSLGINEDLVEAISLAHDLGHTPFGHNLQSLRVVDLLERRYPHFDGLNLSFETREGILKHCSRTNAQALETAEPDGVGQRFLVRQQPSLEAQLCNLADEIAYNAHDIDDGVRSGLLTMDQLRDVPLFDRYRAEALSEYPELDTPSGQRRLLYDAIRRMLSAQVYDVINTTQAGLAQSAPSSVEAVRTMPTIVGFGDCMRAQSQELKSFLLSRLYRHEQVVQTMGNASQIVRDLFRTYMASPPEMKPSFAEWAKGAAEPSVRARVVADFIAGMTDRYAAREHERLTGQRLLD